MDAREVARVVKQWLTLESEIASESGLDQKTYIQLDADITAAKQGLDGDTEPVRQRFANLLFSGGTSWLRADSDELANALPQWFIARSNDEYYLEQYATGSRTDISSVLNFLSARLAMWERGESRPQQNTDYEAGTWPAGTQWYKYEDGQWLYSPTQEGTDWQTMDQRGKAAAPQKAQQAAAQVAAAPVVDVSTPELAQQAAAEVASVVQNILASVVAMAPEAAADIGEERLKQLALEALKAAVQG